MKEYDYTVQVPLAGTPGYYDLCVCATAQYASEVVRALLDADESPPYEVRVICRLRLERRERG